MDKLHIIKVGGTILNDENLLQSFLDVFAKIPGNKILVHGGGKKATQLSKDLGIETKMIEGRRITDASTLDIVVMVYAGLVNKTIVAKLSTYQINALGLSGADMNIIKSHKRINNGRDYGYVGDVNKVDGKKLHNLIDLGITPVICPITHNKKGQLLNTNADTIASSIASEMTNSYEVVLKYCFEYPGVMKDISIKDSVINSLDKQLYKNMKETGEIYSGMLPKIDNAFASIDKGVSKVAICGIDNLITENNLTWIN